MITPEQALALLEEAERAFLRACGCVEVDPGPEGTERWDLPQQGLKACDRRLALDAMRPRSP